MLTDFRSYSSARLEIDARPIVLTGPNGAGKTNLLEAISLLTPGRGLRRAKLSDVTRHGTTNGWAVAARLTGPDGDIDLGTGLQRGPSANGGDFEPQGEAEKFERRVVRIDGETASGPGALAGLLNVSWLTPQMDRLFQEGAAGRRRFLDRLVFGFDPEHGRRLTTYEKAMRERSRLLKTRSGDRHWLAALENLMAEHGIAVAAARNEAVARLTSALAERDARIAESFPQPGLALNGATEGWLTEMPALAAEDRFRDELAANRRRDAEAGGAVVGPHRSDLLVRHAAKDMPASLCSTGEQKALLIGIVLADARLKASLQGMAPVLLLDEVAAHLDADRRRVLFDEICALGAQAWTTGTDAEMFAGLRGRAQFFTVADGVLTPGLDPAGSS